MIIKAIIRYKKGSTQRLDLNNYSGPEDLEPAREVINRQYANVQTILFLIPKEQPV